MRIFINGISALQGGGVTYLNAIIKELLKYDDLQVEVWGFSKIDKDLASERLNIVPLRGVHNNIVRRVFVEKFVISKYLKREYFDIAFFPGGIITSSVPKYTKAVTMFRNMLPFNPKILAYYGYGYRTFRLWLLRNLFIISFKKADSVIFISKHARSVVKNYISDIEYFSEVITHGTDEQFRVLKQPKEGGDYFIYVSIYTNYKHQKEIVEGAKLFYDRHGFAPRIKMRGYTLESYKKEVETMVKEYEMDDFIEVGGSISYSEIPNVYAESRGIIFASSCENCPNILLEAMATGKVILCSNVQPMPEFLGKGGIYFDPYYPESISQAFEKLLINNINTREYINEALELSKTHTWTISANLTYQLFKKMV